MATQIESIPQLELSRDSSAPGSPPGGTETLEPPADSAAGASIHNLLAEVAHDLCTPVYSIGTTVELLLETFESLDKLDKDEAARLLRRVRQGTRWLQDMLGDLTHGRAALGSERLCAKPISLGRCLERSVPIVQPLLDLRAQRVDLRLPQRPVIIWGDEHLLRRVVLNLLSNAAKYSREHDVIELELTTSSEWALVEVRDHGQGVRPLDQMRIFNRATRGRHEDLENGPAGCGLGLSIVKSLVELHGGTVGVRSEAGQGATFWFKLRRIGARRGARPARPLT